MATYEELHGKRVEVFTTDPTLDSSYEGQVWFNSTEGVNKTVVSSGTWISVQAASNGRSSAQGFGTQTSAVMAGGATGPGNQSYVEHYNGIGWAAGGAMPTTRQDGGGAGTETAGVVWCGEGPAKLNTTAEYDGSSWTVTNTYPITARGVRGSGTQTAALGVGGDTPSPAASNVSAEYDGSSWTAGNTLPGNRVAAATSGPQTSALVTTGKDNTPNPSVSNLNTAYDGTNWTAQTVYPLSLRQASSVGTSSSANLVAGGVGAAPFGDAVTTAAKWDGSSWTTTGSLGTKSTHMGYAGTSTASLICGGAQDYPSYPGVSQEFNQSISTITAAAWSAGGALPAATSGLAAAGTTNSSILAWGGYNPPGSGITTSLLYNGTSWTATPSLPAARVYQSGSGTATAAISGSGGDPPVTNSDEYDGSSWSAGGSMNTGRRHLNGNGPQTAAFVCGGYTGTTPTAATEEYNGSSWSNGGNLNTARYGISAGGSEPAGLAMGGGQPGSPPAFNNTEEYNGSAWTNVTALPAGRGYGIGYGPQTAAKQVNGYSGTANVSTTFDYDGTVFSTAASTATSRQDGAGGGTDNTVGVATGGYAPPGNISATEEYSTGTETVASKTLTTS